MKKPPNRWLYPLCYNKKMMTPEEYLKKSKHTMPEDVVRNIGKEEMDLLHAAVGVATESAELVDQVKKHIIYGNELDKTNLLEECGDILWYMAIILRNYDSSFEKVMEANIEKLKVRYPDKFSQEKCNNRDLGKEDDILKKTLES